MAPRPEVTEGFLSQCHHNPEQELKGNPKTLTPSRGKIGICSRMDQLLMGKKGFGLGREGVAAREGWIGESKVSFGLDFFPAVHGSFPGKGLALVLLIP